MPRIAGQIDLSKYKAILDAAIQVLGERGLAASMEEIARRAGVSKQTVYNHYGSKAELVRELSDRRVGEIAAALHTAEVSQDPRAALASFGRALLDGLLQSNASAFMRLAIAGAGEYPEIATAFYEAGPRESRRRLAEFLRQETAAGRLDAPDPLQAAEFFAGMVIGSYQTARLLGVDRGLTAADIDAIAEEAAARFVKAYGK
jgi:AcrR family transcriptional regulator